MWAQCSGERLAWPRSPWPWPSSSPARVGHPSTRGDGGRVAASRLAGRRAAGSGPGQRHPSQRRGPSARPRAGRSGGVVVLGDGTVLVAENGADRVSGFGGGFGATPVQIVGVPAPSGLAVGADGQVFVTSPGEVGRIDLATRHYSTLAGGLSAPTGPAVRDDVLYVPDLQSGEVAPSTARRARTSARRRAVCAARRARRRRPDCPCSSPSSQATPSCVSIRKAARRRRSSTSYRDRRSSHSTLRSQNPVPIGRWS